MYMNTFMNSSDNDKLNKDLTSVESNIPIALKDDTYIEKPVIEVSNTVSNFNYCYISDFDRYYFVTSKGYSQQRYIYQLEVDPLMSFRDEIEDLELIANKSSSKFNLYQIDKDVPRDQRDIINLINFQNGFNGGGGEEYILAVAGGYQPEPGPEPEPSEEVSDNGME